MHPSFSVTCSARLMPWPAAAVVNTACCSSVSVSGDSTAGMSAANSCSTADSGICRLSSARAATDSPSSALKTRHWPTKSTPFTFIGSGGASAGFALAGRYSPSTTRLALRASSKLPSASNLLALGGSVCPAVNGSGGLRADIAPLP
eukprot:scaffold40526_cov71-Phaeocystis_antarctica.AAC.3